jgi:hypothetical protein
MDEMIRREQSKRHTVSQSGLLSYEKRIVVVYWARFVTYAVKDQFLHLCLQLADVLDGDDEEKLQLELVKIEAELKALDDLEKQLHAQQDFGDKVNTFLTY